MERRTQIDPPQNDELRRQNAALDDQVKRLVRTEKRLYQIQKDLDRQMSRVDTLNRLALAQSLTFAPDRILSGALDTFVTTLQFTHGLGFSAGSDQALRVCACVGLEAQRAETMRERCLEVAALRSLNEPLLFDAACPPELSPEIHALREALTEDEEVDKKTEHAIMLVLPLRLPKDGRLVGLLLLSCLDTRTHSYHTRLPAQEDLPFVRLVRAHVETALEKASLYQDLTDMASSLERKVKERTTQLEYYAARDPLTHLFNHRMFWELLEYEVKRSERHERPFGLLVIDVDNFKSINDAYGHERGDRCLVQLAEIMRSNLRGEDILARYGGDEFAVILVEAGAEQSYVVAQRILQATAARPLDLGDGVSVSVSLSIGLAVFPEHARNARELFVLGDNAVYLAKQEGKHAIRIPTKDDLLAGSMEKGDKVLMEAGGHPSELLVPFFQPVLDLRSGAIVAYEVLMRLLVDGVLRPAVEFIHRAERLGIINRLDDALRQKVFARMAEEGFKGMIFLNLSPRALMVKELAESVTARAREWNIRPEQTVFEITERETVRNVTLIETFVSQLRTEGFRFAVDDFGSGFASFNYIKKFSVDFLKIDGEFVRNMMTSKVDRAFVYSIVTLARKLGIKTVAEFVEDEAILNAVRSAGVDYAQGYFIGRPGPDLTGTAPSGVDKAARREP